MSSHWQQVRAGLDGKVVLPVPQETAIPDATQKSD